MTSVIDGCGLAAELDFGLKLKVLASATRDVQIEEAVPHRNADEEPECGDETRASPHVPDAEIADDHDRDVIALRGALRERADGRR